MKIFNKSNAFDELIKDIDVSDANYEKAIRKYESIAKTINDDDRTRPHLPEIYVQGSFRLGTAIKPLVEEGSYDIDLVCSLNNLTKGEITQYNLKHLVGDIVKDYANEHNMSNPVKESSRCWTLAYVDEDNFHIDILPAILDKGQFDDTIAITDKNTCTFKIISNNWEVSNPKGYAEWFNNIGKFEWYKTRYIEKNLSNVNCSIEDVPYYKIKTDLQRVVQILKRHAEVFFKTNIEYKPSSIIITTLVAKSYHLAVEISNDFEELIVNTIKLMPKGIEKHNNNPCVYNPVNRDEILSCKWEKDEEYYKAFVLWLEQLKMDFNVDAELMSEKDRMFYINRSLKRSESIIGIQLSSLKHHQRALWDCSKAKLVSIKTSYAYDGFRYHEIGNGQVIMKTGRLKFEIFGINTKGYDVYWQITNTGSEAKNAGCLRGDFYNSRVEKGKKVRYETASYYGRHYVEAFLIKNGKCEYKSAPFEVNIINGVDYSWVTKKA